MSYFGVQGIDPIRGLPRALSALAVAATLLAGSSAFAERRASPYDEDLPLSFVGTLPAVADGRPVEVIGMAPDFVRVVYENKKKLIANSLLTSLKFDGPGWEYRPSSTSFEDFVRTVAETSGYAEQYGATANSDAVLAVFEEVNPPPVVPTTGSNFGTGTGMTEQVSLPPPPTARNRGPRVAPPTPRPKVEQAPTSATPTAADGTGSGVPDWVKFASVAAAAFIIVRFFRN